MLKIGAFSLLRPKLKQPWRPLLCQVSLRVHIRTDEEYHSRAYAIRVTPDTTELLIADQFHKLTWIDMARVEVVE